MFSYQFSVSDDRELVSFVMKKMLSCKKNKIMRRRFLSYDLFQTIIPVFAVSISAPLSTWKNAVHILTTRSRESGGINVGKYAVDIASSNYVCTMGDTQSIDCHMTPSGSGINCYFNNGNVTGDIYLTFYLEDVLYYFYITDKTNDSDLRPQLSMDVDKYFIDTIHIIKTISDFVAPDTYLKGI